MTNNQTLIRYFELGMNHDGYWNYNHMALQNEDSFHVLSIKYPNYDFFFIMDNSSGHGKMAENALNVYNMSVQWGGKQSKMHHTIVHDVGGYYYNDPMKLQVGDIQPMIFLRDHSGPFFLDKSERKRLKKDTVTTQKHIYKRTKTEIMHDLHSKHNFKFKKSYTLNEIYNLDIKNKFQSKLHHIKPSQDG